ncbi:MAG: acetyltransferase [Verrucomicrobiales bacterium]|nr:acetyltransferase [Verrucomicrobiales bacterium]
MNPQYRSATINDYDAMLHLWKSTPGMGLGGADSHEGIQRILERNPGLSTVAEIERTIVGTALCSQDGRRGFIYHLAVDAPYQKRGIGRALVDSSLELFRQEGITCASVVVYASNKEGREFWSRLGWRLRDDVVMFSTDLLP